MIRIYVIVQSMDGGETWEEKPRLYRDSRIAKMFAASSPILWPQRMFRVEPYIPEADHEAKIAALTIRINRAATVDREQLYLLSKQASEISALQARDSENTHNLSHLQDLNNALQAENARLRDALEHVKNALSGDFKKRFLVRTIAAALAQAQPDAGGKEA